MGAGCYYTSRIDQERTFWVEIAEEDEEDYSGFEWEDTLQNILDVLEGIGYSCSGRQRRATNGFFDISLESTYHGEGIVLDFDVLGGLDASTEALARATYAKSWRKVARNLMKWGFKLRIATSGYTARYMEQSDVA